MFIGRSSDSAKGNALRQSREMLKHSAPNVLTLSGLATPEGLLNQFVKPTEKVEDSDDGEITTYWGGFADGMNNPERIRYILDDMCEKESPQTRRLFRRVRLCAAKSYKNERHWLIGTHHAAI